MRDTGAGGWLLVLGLVAWAAYRTPRFLRGLFSPIELCAVCRGAGATGPSGDGPPIPGRAVVPCRRCKGAKVTSRILKRPRHQ